ncbi:MAG: hypothetical protein Q9196_000618 [Gyalolechia fulgens]
MTQIVYIALYPLLFLISIPLMTFALFTTFAASGTLLLRVLIVYADLAAVLIKNRFLHPPPSDTPPSPRPEPDARAPGHSGRRRSSSGDSHVSWTPRSGEGSSGLGIYSAGISTDCFKDPVAKSSDLVFEGVGRYMHRDFEGVGGWRIPHTEREDILWTSINARLELPALADGRHRHHRRSITESGTPSPASSAAAAAAAASVRSVGGTASPEGYFVPRHGSRSATGPAPPPRSPPRI